MDASIELQVKQNGGDIQWRDANEHPVVPKEHPARRVLVEWEHGHVVCIYQTGSARHSVERGFMATHESGYGLRPGEPIKGVLRWAALPSQHVDFRPFVHEFATEGAEVGVSHGGLHRFRVQGRIVAGIRYVGKEGHLVYSGLSRRATKFSSKDEAIRYIFDDVVPRMAKKRAKRAASNKAAVDRALEGN